MQPREATPSVDHDAIDLGIDPSRIDALLAAFAVGLMIGWQILGRFA